LTLFALLLAGLLTGGEPVSLQAHPIPLFPNDVDTTRIGPLEYRGGLFLTSDDPRFGGLSGLEVSDDGTLFAVTDQGHWLTARLLLDRGVLVGIAGGELGELTDASGARLTTKRDQDAEALAAYPGGRRLIAFERHHRVQVYEPESGSTAPSTMSLPPELDRAPQNGGIEALTVMQDGRVLLLTERLPTKSGVRGWLGTPGAWEPFDLAVEGIARPSGATTLPSGDVVILERGYTPMSGTIVRLRLIPARDILAGALVEGTLLAELHGPMNVDNFEGIAASLGPNGEVLLFLLSDDNFNPLQRTLLFLFALEAPASS
jgi:hypothetical protein